MKSYTIESFHAYQGTNYECKICKNKRIVSSGIIFYYNHAISDQGTFDFASSKVVIGRFKAGVIITIRNSNSNTPKSYRQS